MCAWVHSDKRLVGWVSCDAAPLGLPPYFGAGLVISDDGLRDVDVRLHLVFDFNVLGGWPLVAAVAIVGDRVGTESVGLWLCDDSLFGRWTF